MTRSLLASKRLFAALTVLATLVMPIAASAHEVHGTPSPSPTPSPVDYCLHNCPVVPFTWTTKECPTDLSAYTSSNNDLACKSPQKIGSHWKYAKKIVVSHSADVAYNKSGYLTKCHRPSDDDLAHVYGMNHDAVQAFKDANKEVMTSITSAPDGYFLSNGVCYPNPTPTPTPSSTPSPTPTSSPTPSSTPSPTPTETPIPVYAGTATCSQGTAPVLVGSHIINATDIDGESFAVSASAEYLFKASGTFTASSDTAYQADAGYTSHDGWVSLLTQYGIHGTPPDTGAHALLANLGSGVGILDWGTYATSHSYAVSFAPTTGTAQFVIGDRWDSWFVTPYQNQAGMADNQGSLNLDVYKCTAPVVTTPPAPVCVNDQVSTYVETVGVPSGSLTGATSLASLESGRNYVLRATGTWTNNGGLAVSDQDAEHISYDNWVTPMDGDPAWVGAYGFTPYQDELDLQVNNGFVNWGPFTSTHTYDLPFVGTGTTASFRVFDGYPQNAPAVESGWYGDNTDRTPGLAVAIYSCPKPQEEPKTISGMKFSDGDQNGSKGAGEPGLAGWHIWVGKKVGSYTIPAGSDSGIPIEIASLNLTSGTKYMLHATGTFDGGDSITGDAQFSIRAPSTTWTDIVQTYESYGVALLDLQLNDVSPDWGSFNGGHSYWTQVTGTGASVNFRINDFYPQNDTGALTVDVYEVVGETVTDASGNYSMAMPTVGGTLYLGEVTQDGWTQTSTPAVYSFNDGHSVSGDIFGNYQYVAPQDTPLPASPTPTPTPTLSPALSPSPTPEVFGIARHPENETLGSVTGGGGGGGSGWSAPSTPTPTPAPATGAATGGGGQVTTTPTPAPTPTPVVHRNPPVVVALGPTVSASPTPSPTPSVSPLELPNPLLAAAGTGFLGLGWAWYWWLLVLIVVCGIVWYWRRQR